MKKKILVIGSSNMDLSLNLYKIPAPGEAILDDGGVAYTPGGNGANSAIAFSKLGATTVFCTKLGADVHGQQLYKFYRDQGLDTSCIKVDHEFATGFSVVLKEGENAPRTVCYPGANTHISADSMAQAFISNPDALSLSFEITFNNALAAAKIAESRNIPIFIDAAPASKDYALESLPFVEIFSPNEQETFEYTGVKPEGADSSMRASLALWRRVKCKYVVIKQGARGASIWDGKHFQMVPAVRPDKVLDTSGAGDTFTAAMTLEYLNNGGDIKAAVKYAAAAAAITVSRQGTASSVPTEQEVVDFINNRRY